MEKALYAKACEVAWKHKDLYPEVLLRIGTFHSGARGEPWVRKFGNPLIRNILVLTSAYVRPSVQTLGEGDGSPKTA